MVSIIKIKIDPRLFLEQLYNNKNNNKSYLSEKFLNLIKNITRYVDFNNSTQTNDFWSNDLFYRFY